MGRYFYKTINGVKKRLHIHVMEAHLGRKLHDNEHVYHINGDSKDNQISNLIIITKRNLKENDTSD